MQQPVPVTLSGRHVRLEPMQMELLDAVWQAADAPELWTYSLVPMASRDDIRAYMEQALAEREQGRALPFVQYEQGSGTLVGSTRFGNIDVFNRRLEIGWTWINPRWQRTAINTEAKLLLLTHAFESLGCRRVEFKGDARNMKSRNALERIGAVYEGTLRKHMLSAGDFQRDSFYYSVIAEEWPHTKAALEEKLRPVI